MRDTPLTLMCVHAHPDDECISTGGILAKYAGEGIHTVLVTCTKGELGEVSDPDFKPPRPDMSLTEIRMAELADAIEFLKVGSFHCLDYKDSGMAGTDGNNDPEAFVQADLHEAANRLVRLIRETRPQVVVTYDEYGVYGHPDHIMANRITQKAFDAAGDPAVTFDDGTPPWQPDKLYYFALPSERLEKYSRLGSKDGEETFRPPTTLKATPADQITTRIDIAPYLEDKFKAIYAHKSQIGSGHLFRRLTKEQKQAMFGREHYVCVRGNAVFSQHSMEDDLFAGLR